MENRRQGKPWYLLFAGVYPDRSAAAAALKRLPDNLKSAGPWVRPLADLKWRKIANWMAATGNEMSDREQAQVYPPSVDQVLRWSEVTPLICRYGRLLVTSAIRSAFQDIKTNTGSHGRSPFIAAEFISAIEAALAKENRPRLRASL